jgi:glycosyltransferase involved in cell wall biosynthesis
VGGGARGIGHYAAALLDALRRTFPMDEWRVVLPRGPVSVPVPGAVRSPVPGRVLFGAAAIAGRPRLDRLAGGCDVVWLPAPAPVAVSRGVPVVLTIHDRSWEVRPGDFTPYERAWHALARPRRLARRAGRVLTTTEVGRADVVDAWGLQAARARTVPLAPVHVPAAPGPPAGAPAAGPAAAGPARPAGAPAAVPPAARPARPAAAVEPYFLFVGALEPRKGPDVLAEAVRIARGRGLHARVVVVGEGRVPVPGLERAGRADADRLSALYAGALALVAPSRLEGFGLPALEALAHGTPAVVSDLPPVREVLGDAARYVTTGDPGALAAALLNLEAHPHRVEPPAAARRTWDEVARETRAVLAEAAG